jgi:hypothetical protein
MPIHDWTRVESRVFHDFHNTWLIELKKSLNGGVLPPGHYALTDVRVGITGPDVATFRATPSSPTAPSPVAPAVALVERPTGRPVRRQARPRTVRVFESSGHQLVAVVELVSAANKDRRGRVRQFAEKVYAYLTSGVHVMVVDLLPPTPSAPNGFHPEIWSYFGRPRYVPPADAPLTLVGYRADGDDPRAYIEPTAVGRVLTPMPLFLSGAVFVDVPLEETYLRAFAETPSEWRRVLEA